MPKKSGNWGCRCRSCRQNQLLTHSNTVLLGSRYFYIEILAAADVLRRTRKLAAQYLFARAVRKLLRRFDAVLWQDEENKIKAALGVAAEIEELLDQIEPGKDISTLTNLDKIIEAIAAHCKNLCSENVADKVHVNQIRRLSYWVHLSSLSVQKSIIIENADRMQGPPSNALLKLLEEPPKNVSFFLLTTRKSQVVPTIRSRLRTYSFQERSVETQLEVLRVIFRQEPDGFRSLRDYLMAWKDIKPSELAKLARTFFELVVRDADQSLADRGTLYQGSMMPAVDLPQALVDNFNGRAASELLTSFAEELLYLFQAQLRKQTTGGDGALTNAHSSVSLGVLERWSDLLQHSLLTMNSFNLNPQLVVENLYYRMRETL